MAFSSAIYCLLNWRCAATFMPGDEGNESHEGSGEMQRLQFFGVL